LGAWIGTTAIWLSKNFKEVIAVEADHKSLECLKLNLAASECDNIKICEKPITATGQTVVFGPRGGVLNESISCVKDAIAGPLDYSVKSLTFKELINEYAYSKKITFIKCDIEGGEENIIEDLLYFAFYNNCSVHLSFHHGWWVSKKIEDYEYLFDFFEVVNYSQVTSVVHFVRENPFGALLLRPKRDAGDLIIRERI
jgi:FkbM family methyltransferase